MVVGGCRPGGTGRFFSTGLAYYGFPGTCVDFQYQTRAQSIVVRTNYENA